MEKILTPSQLDSLQQIDTPTICNAIETFNVRGRVDGFIGMGIHCLTPEFGSMLGYAVTVTVNSTTPDIPRDEFIWQAWVKAMHAATKPVVLVFKDVGPQPLKSAHFGEVMGTLSRRLGVVGLITDGGVRDIMELKRLGLHCFAAGLVPSHGNPRLLSVNTPVEIDGVHVKSGDLLHGDANGVTTIPWAVVAELARAAQKVRGDQARQFDYMNSPDFSIEGYFQRRSSH